MEDFYAFMEKNEAEREAMGERHSKERLAHPYYPDGFIFDENESVRWNKEKVAEENKTHFEMMARHQEEENVIFKKVEDRILEELKENYDFSDALCQIVYNKAYEDGHHAGGYEIHSYALDYASFAEDVLNTINTKS